MATLQVPVDLAADLESALRWYGRSTAAGVEFYALVAADTPWRAARPRAMICWSERRKVRVDGERLLTVTLAGFYDDRRSVRVRQAKAALRQAAADVAAGREAPLITGPGIHVWPDGPQSGDQWSRGAWESPSRIPASHHGSPADGMQPSLPATAAPSSAPAAAPSSPPSFPRGGWMQR